MTSKTGAAVGVTDENLLNALSASQSEPDWLLDRRLEAWARYESLPLPSLTDEKWRRTDLSGLDPTGFAAFGENGHTHGASHTARSALATAEFAGQNLQVDWFHQSNRLDPTLASKGVIFCSMDEAVREHPNLVREYLPTEVPDSSMAKFDALQAAFWRGGNFLFVPDGMEVEIPLHSFLWVTRPGIATFSQTTVVVGRSARVQFVDEQASATIDGSALAGGRVDLFIGDNARLDYTFVQDWGLHTSAFKSVRAQLGRDAAFNYAEFALGSRLAKSTVEGTMPQPGARCELWGLSLLDGHRHLDHETHQHHIADHTFSNLMYKGVIREQGRSVFYGMITVENTAGQSNSYQANDNLLLSDEARADSIPGMVIKTYDVRCTHGATIGRLDEEELFYLHSRGFTREQAEWLVVRGYFGPVLDRVANDQVREDIEAVVLRRAASRD